MINPENIFLSDFSLFYLYGFTNKPNLRLIQFFALLILITLFILSCYNTYFSGYWASKIIFWTWFFSAMVLHGFGSKKRIYSFEKVINTIVFFLPLAFIPLLLVPFLGGALLLRFHESFIGDDSMILYSSNKIRVEQSYIPFMSPAPPIDIYTKSGLFSHKDTTLDIQYNEKLDSLKVIEFSPDSITLVYYNNTDTFNGGPVQEFSIRLHTK